MGTGKTSDAKVARNKRGRRLARNLIVVGILYGAGMAAVWAFSLINVSTLVVFPVFVLGILIACLESDSGLWGALLGVGYLLSYDFFFTEPLYGLKVLSRTDVVALVIFLIVALIMGIITHRMRRQATIAERNALALGRLNRLSCGLFESATPDEACRFSEEFLSKALGRSVAITLGRPSADAEAAALDCYEQHCPTGFGELGYPDATQKFLPFGLKGHIRGVVAIDCALGELDSSSRTLLAAVLAQTLVAVERNGLSEERRSTHEESDAAL